mmetsp:Transcript_131400/g.293993  ORF Transcript_131400/g.293993 Transcript_131400/m.293993 type:complete len:563 (-) Transcript_131400:97-1785(-)
MPVPRGRRRERIGEEEVRRRFWALSLEQRQAALEFDDPCLLERIQSALAELFNQQTLMRQLGISLGCEDDSDPFEASTLLKEAFEFRWSMGRHKQNPNLVLVDPRQRPMMVIKDDFLTRPDIFERFQAVLPDILAPRTARTPLPRARWKELWTSEPSSIIALEQQLARLVEQALWAMDADGAVCSSSETGASPVASGAGGREATAAATDGDAVAVFDDQGLEPWMREHDQGVVRAKEAAARRKKAKKKSQGQKARVGPGSVPLEPMAEEVEAALVDDIERDDDEAALAASPEEPVTMAEELVEEATASPTQPPEPQEPEAEAEAAGSEEGSSSSGSFVHGSWVEPPPAWNSKTECTEDDEEPRCMTPWLDDDPCLATGRPDYPPSRTPPSSPSVASGTWQPQQLVCYIWGQTAQFTVQQRQPPGPITGAPGCDASCSAGPNAGAFCGVPGYTSPMDAATRTPSSIAPSLGGSSLGTPWRREGAGWRGLWAPPSAQKQAGGCAIRAVVRKTFIDVDLCDSDPAGPGQRMSRSLSPVRLGARSYGFAADSVECEDSDQWYWYWH